MRPKTEQAAIRSAIEAVASLRERVSAAVLPNDAPLDALQSELRCLHLINMPEPAKTQLASARTVLVQAMATAGVAQNDWTQLRLHIEMAHKALLELVKKSEE